MSITPGQVLYGYSIGVFPMADPEDNNAIYWYEPKLRGILPLEGLKVSKSMKQTLRSGRFHFTINEDFEKVIRGCAQRENTWLSEEIIGVYCSLHEMGHALSFETRNKEGELVGGLYGIRMGRVFFGESMFHTERDASKAALVFLVEWMKENSFFLLDTQYLNDHLKSLGGIEITREEYLEKLKEALL